MRATHARSHQFASNNCSVIARPLRTRLEIAGPLRRKKGVVRNHTCLLSRLLLPRILRREDSREISGSGRQPKFPRRISYRRWFSTVGSMRYGNFGGRRCSPASRVAGDNGSFLGFPFSPASEIRAASIARAPPVRWSTNAIRSCQQRAWFRTTPLLRMSNRKDGQGRGLWQAAASHPDLADMHSGEGSS